MLLVISHSLRILFISLQLHFKERQNEACFPWDTLNLPLLNVHTMSIPESIRTTFLANEPSIPNGTQPQLPDHVLVLEIGGEPMPIQQVIWVYSRRKVSQTDREIVNPTYSQEVESMVDPSLPNESGKPNPNLDLDVLIAFRKGVKPFTQHPISKFISYSYLSPSFHTFTSNISSERIPRYIEEALSVPEWKVAVVKEMYSLKQNNTWSLVEFPHEKVL